MKQPSSRVNEPSFVARPRFVPRDDLVDGILDIAQRRQTRIGRQVRGARVTRVPSIRHGHRPRRSGRVRVVCTLLMIFNSRMRFHRPDPVQSEEIMMRLNAGGGFRVTRHSWRIVRRTSYHRRRTVPSTHLVPHVVSLHSRVPDNRRSSSSDRRDLTVTLMNVRREIYRPSRGRPHLPPTWVLHPRSNWVSWEPRRVPLGTPHTSLRTRSTVHRSIHGYAQGYGAIPRRLHEIHRAQLAILIHLDIARSSDGMSTVDRSKGGRHSTDRQRSHALDGGDGWIG